MSYHAGKRPKPPFPQPPKFATRVKGVACPNPTCHSPHTFVVYCRHRLCATMRVRRCYECGRRFRTVEKIESNVS